MTKYFFTALSTIAVLLLPISGEAQVARKAAVNVKSATAPKPDPAASTKDASPKPAKVEMQSANATPKPAAAATAKPATPSAQPAAPPAQAAANTDKAITDKDKVKDKDKAKDKDDDDGPPPLTVPAGFRYEAQGRRDPFVNPVPKPAGEVAAKVERIVRPDGLPGVLVSEVRLTGIIHASDTAMTKALLAVGKKTYFVRQGDSLFDGVIKEIRPSEVVFTMVSTSTKQPVNKETVLSTGRTSLTSAGERK